MGMRDHLTDAEYEEEVRCAALSLEGPNRKMFFDDDYWADYADMLHKRRKEDMLGSPDGTDIPPPSQAHGREETSRADEPGPSGVPSVFRCHNPEQEWIEQVRDGDD